jgi:hypothetical protein
MSEDNKKDTGNKAANTLKDRPDKKPDLHDYKSEDKDEVVGAPKEEEQLQETEDEKELQDGSEAHNDESLPPGA